jgi:transketolase
VLYDDNGISIDGEVRHWFADDTVRRFEAYGWNVIADIDGHDVWAIDRAIATARDWARNGRDGRFAPTLIQCRTVIGKGSPNRAGTAKAHGEPLGADELKLTRAAMYGGEAPADPWSIPDAVRTAWDARTEGARAQGEWTALFDRYAAQFPDEAAELRRRMGGELPANWHETVDHMVEAVVQKGEKIATRKASQNALNHLGPAVPELLGGSADLTGSNLTDFTGCGAVRAGAQGPEGGATSTTVCASSA